MRSKVFNRSAIPEATLPFSDDLVFYFSTISWLRHHPETMWVNINFERRDLNFVQKSLPSLDDFGEIFAFNLIKQNITHFFHLFKAKLFAVSLCAAVRVLDDPQSPYLLHNWWLMTYLTDGLFLNQKPYKNIWISYSLKYKHSKTNFFTKKWMVVYDEIIFQESTINQNFNNTMSVCLIRW